MTKQALTEQMAQALYAHYVEPSPPTWDLESHERQQEIRRRVKIMMPVIVSFVADFITTECQRDINPETCAQRWREAMA